MPRKKRKQKRRKQKVKPEENFGPFNPALGSLGAFKRQSQAETPESEKPQIQESSPHPLPPGQDEIFLQAMADVEPLKQTKGRVPRRGQKKARPSHPPNSEDMAALTHLYDLVRGTADMDITYSDEYIEGAIPNFDSRIMERLRRGLFPVQDHVDLHGLTRVEAQQQVRDFLLQSFRLGYRCVLVVHGRGLNSENHIPVLKERIPVWLTRGPVRKIILAFSTAKPYDGGTGAIYVLLKRQKQGRYGPVM